MSAHLFLAPASTGKTGYGLNLARDDARDLQSIPRVVVPTHLQVRACRRRLAEVGGAIGVCVLTFDRLYAECLSAAGETYTELSDPVQYRLIRAVVDGLPLTHYAPLTDRPGFIQVLKGLIGELKAARAWPEAFTEAVAALGDEPRLRELAHIYVAYQAHLQAQGWADRAGLGWLTVEALEERAPSVGRDWSLLAVDGFDNFTPVQLALLEVLATRVEDLVVTLTGTTDGPQRALAHRRFDGARRRLEERLGIQAEPLPEQRSRQALPPAHLERNLFHTDVDQVDAADSVDLIEAPDRAAEVRAGLRWLKARLVEDEMRPAEVALLARDVAPYRPFIRQTAVEFGLPIRLVDGLPLMTNPAVAAILDLMRLVLPRAADDPEPALPWRSVVEAWRSPYSTGPPCPRREHRSLLASSLATPTGSTPSPAGGAWSGDSPSGRRFWLTWSPAPPPILRNRWTLLPSSRAMTRNEGFPSVCQLALRPEYCGRSSGDSSGGSPHRRGRTPARPSSAGWRPSSTLTRPWSLTTWIIIRYFLRPNHGPKVVNSSLLLVPGTQSHPESR
jgi:hypothetical protein